MIVVVVRRSRWGVKQYSDNNELYKNTCFSIGPTSTGHSVLIHRGGCRHVSGVKFIRVRVRISFDIRTGKAYGKRGRSGTACRSVYEIADFLADVSAKRVAEKTSCCCTLHSYNVGTSTITSLENTEVVRPWNIEAF
jgi:hypothetical protein